MNQEDLEDDEEEFDPDDFDDEDYETVNFPIQFLIGPNYTLTEDRERAISLICGDDKVGYVEVSIASGWFERITYH